MDSQSPFEYHGGDGCWILPKIFIGHLFFFWELSVHQPIYWLDVGFLVVNVWSYWCVLDINTLSKVMLAKTISHSVDYLFSFLKILCCVEAFSCLAISFDNLGECFLCYWDSTEGSTLCRSCPVGPKWMCFIIWSGELGWILYPITQLWVARHRFRGTVLLPEEVKRKQGWHPLTCFPGVPPSTQHNN